MKFTDLFIYRPVLAMVVSLLIFFVGLASIAKLDIRQYPKMDTSQITITTSYPGANQSIIQGFVTQPLEAAIAGVEGIDYMTSVSTNGTSTINVNLKLNYDINAAASDINAAVQSVRYLLPKGILDPVIAKGSVGLSIMYLGYYSKTLSAEQITDYLNRVVVPHLQTVPGVAQAKVLGGRTFSMRIWLDPNKMATFHVTPSDVSQALTNNNVLSSSGNLRGKYDQITIMANTDLISEAGFNNMVIKNSNGRFVRIRDVGEAVLGPQSTDFNIHADGNNAVVISIDGLAAANPLDVSKGIRAMLPQIEKQFPSTLHQEILYDTSIFINESIRSVIKTIIEAVIIVLIVIFLFLGNLRAVSIPIVTIPLCLVGVGTFMLWLGFTINTLTLLAMVLAIGLVVDDAIVVVENISRHLEMGETPIHAAIHGAREIAMPVVTMSTTLAAVFIPIGFLGGLTGKLFTEFAFVLAATVIISGIIALTLSPMMCSRILSNNQLHNGFTALIDRVFKKIVQVYRKLLLGTMNAKPVAVFFAIVVLIACFFLYSTTPEELAPNEDQSYLIIFSAAPANANIDYTTRYLAQLSSILQKVPHKKADMTLAGLNGVTTGISFIVIDPVNTRPNLSIFDVQGMLTADVNKNITGTTNYVILPPTLPGTAQGAPVQFVLQTIGSYESLNTSMEELIGKAMQSGLFMYADSDLKYQQPQLNVDINRDLAQNVGINSADIAQALGVDFSSNYITQFNMDGRSYQVIPQVYPRNQWNPSDINAVYINTASGNQIPLSSLIAMHYSVVPNGLNQFQQLNSATLQASPMPGVSLGQALNFLKKTADEILPPEIAYNYDGQSRQFVQQPGVGLLFGFALIFIFLILSAQFESFREPVVILVSVPLCMFVALLLLNVGLGTINIFTKIGLLTLIGLIAKQGILIVEFANKKQEHEGLSIEQAVIEAACIRLRPILMTTAAMFFGVLPMLFTKAGLIKSEQQLAIVLMSGILFGTLFTIFVVPVFYSYLAKPKKKVEQIN